MVAPDLLFSKEHQWLRLEGETAAVGITDYAQDELGEIIYVEMPEIGAKVAKGGLLGTIESIKTTSEFFAPIGGTVREVNERLRDDPTLLNNDPYGRGWICKLVDFRPEDAGDLMGAEAYEKLVEAEKREKEH